MIVAPVTHKGLQRRTELSPASRVKYGRLPTITRAVNNPPEGRGPERQPGVVHVMGRMKVATFAMTGLLMAAPMMAHAAFDSTVACSSGVGTIGSTFTDVELAIQAGQFTKTSEQTNLLTKLSAAYSKTLTPKYPDAISKLEEISDIATKLANPDKPGLVSADAINAAVLTAVQCISFPVTK
jgi:hypothetical protein